MWVIRKYLLVSWFERDLKINDFICWINDLSFNLHMISWLIQSKFLGFCLAAHTILEITTAISHADHFNSLFTPFSTKMYNFKPLPHRSVGNLENWTPSICPTLTASCLYFHARMHIAYAYQYCICVSLLHMHIIIALAHKYCICICNIAYAYQYYICTSILHMHIIITWAHQYCICISILHMQINIAYANQYCICISIFHMHINIAYTYQYYICIAILHMHIIIA